MCCVCARDISVKMENCFEWSMITRVLGGTLLSASEWMFGFRTMQAANHSRNYFTYFNRLHMHGICILHSIKSIHSHTDSHSHSHIYTSYLLFNLTNRLNSTRKENVLVYFNFNFARNKLLYRINAMYAFALLFRPQNSMFNSITDFLVSLIFME